MLAFELHESGEGNSLKPNGTGKRNQIEDSKHNERNG
jgi:hypothetical protein